MKYFHKLLALEGRILLALIILTGMTMQFIALFVLLEPNNLSWVDPKEYYSIAQNLANGEPYSTVENSYNLIRSPGYPGFLSVLIFIFGNNVLTIRIIHILLLPVFIISVFHIGKKLKNVSLGLVFSLLCVVYPYYIYIPLTLYSESITIYLFPLIILLIMNLRESSRTMDAIFLAFVSAFLIMCRPTNVYLILVSLIYIFWNNRINLKRILLFIPTVILPIILVLLWMGRNKRVHNEFIFSTGGSIVLNASYNQSVVPGKKDWPAFSEELLKELDETDSDLEKAIIMEQHAKRFIKENPWMSAKIAFFNVLNYWNPIPLTYGEEGDRMGKYKIIPAFFYSLFLILGIIGYYNHKKFLIANTFLLLLVFNTVLNAPFMVSVRYRIVVDYCFILFASYTVLSIYENIFTGKKRRTQDSMKTK